jgi:hypothetical protein
MPSRQAQGWEVSLQVSALEIYNEKIRDLLEDDLGNKKLDIVQDAKTGEP